MSKFLSDLKQVIVEDLGQAIRIILIAVLVATGFIGHAIYF